MRIKFLVVVLLGTAVLFAGCDKDADETSFKNGVLAFKCYNPLASDLKEGAIVQKSGINNPPLVDDTTVTLNTSLNVCIGDVWVSKDEIKVGNIDELEWIRLTSVTNTEHKLFEDYTFPEVELPEGEYKSLKISFRNIWYRHVVLESDHSVKYELLETMGSSDDPCDPYDESWAPASYLTPNGSFSLDEDGKFRLASQGEKVDSFTILSGKKAIVTWRLGAGATEPCINYLIDVNGNREWDCGVDELIIECPPSVQYMWDFVVTYQ